MAGILAARLLGPEMRGELAALLLLPLTLQLVSLAGLPHAQTVLTAQRPSQVAAITGTTLTLMIFPCLLAIVVGLLAMPFLFADSALQQHAAWLLVCLVPLLTFYGTPTQAALGLKAYGIYNLYRIIAAVLYLGAVMLAWWQPSPTLITWGYVLLLGLMGLPLSVWLCRRYLHATLKWDKSLLAPLYRFALPTFLSQLPQVLAQRIDQILVLTILNTTALGYYSIALAVGQMLNGLQQIVGSILLPYLAGSAQEGRSPTLLFGRAIRLTAVVSLLVALSIGCLIPWLLPWLFGQAFAPAVTPAILLIIGFALTGVHMAFMDGFRGLDLPRLPLQAEWVAFACKGLLMGGGLAWLQAPTLTQVALLACIASLPPLLYDGILYHRYVEPLSLRWWRQLAQDSQALLSQLKLPHSRPPDQ